MSDKDGQTPVGLITKNRFSRLLEFCNIGLAYKLDLNKTFVVAKQEHTLLTFIIANNLSMEVFSLLHNKGADINKGDGKGLKPIMHLIRQNREEDVVNLVKSYQNLFTKAVDNEGKNVIHHVVTPRDFGSYENTSLLEFLSRYADINHQDRQGHPPIFYAKLQESGKMEKALLKLKAKETDMQPGSGILRTTTTMLESMEFPSHQNDFQEDFEKFVEECKIESKKKQQKVDERVPVDPKLEGKFEVVYDGEDPYDCFMVKVDVNKGYYSGNVFYKM